MATNSTSELESVVNVFVVALIQYLNLTPYDPLIKKQMKRL